MLVLAILAGLLTALLLHWLTWTIRHRYPSAALVLGALGALGLTGFCLLFLNSDIAVQVLIVLRIFWITALVLGSLQAYALGIAWWKGILSIFLEMALAFLAGSAVNLGLQRAIPWWNDRFPGLDVYTIINAFLWSMIGALLALAILRPLLLLSRRREP
jgi:hypothetical protein